MQNRLAGKVAVISGGARGQGRAHAIRLAKEGADIVAFDICEPLEYPDHPAATWEDLEETRRLVEEEDRRCFIKKVDARDLAALRALADEVMAEFGRLDILVINHGIWTVAPNTWELEEESWQESIDVLLTGAWKVSAAFAPKMIEAGNGGSVILTASSNGTIPQPGAAAYTVAKHGIIGLMRVLAVELGQFGIRVNAVSPGSIATPMTTEGGTIEKSAKLWPKFFGTDRSLLPVGWVKPDVVAGAVAFLASDDAAHVSSVDLFVDAGYAHF